MALVSVDGLELLSLSPLLHQCGSALTDFLKRHFEATKRFQAQFREDSPHLPGMLSEGWNNEVLAARCQGDDPNAPVFGALDPADQALHEETVHSYTDRAWRQIDDRAYRIDGQRPLVEQHFQHAEIRVAEPCIFNTGGCVARQRAHCLHHYKPDVIRLLGAWDHKNMNLPKVYIINYIDFNMIGAMVTGCQPKRRIRL
jgi:hypothetical protein